jgi:hypothetical protein
MRRGRAIEVEVLDPPGGTVVKPKWEQRFVKRPWDWVKQLRTAKLPSTSAVADVLLYEHWIKGGRPFPLSNKKVPWMNRRMKWRALAELEALGLITVERHPRRSPWITCLTAKT